MATYTYDPLPAAGHHIRLATLQPGKFDEDIIISLDQHFFARDGSLEFEALSYVWGEPDNSASLHIGGNEGPKLVASQVLVTVLRHLRYIDRTRVIWVDGICIDQLNLIEKGPQVAMMGEIYRLATRVVVWLGQEADHSSIALDLTSKIGAQLEVIDIPPFLKPAPGCIDPSLVDMSVMLPLNEEDTRSIYHLLYRPWFERLWVRQEILLANTQAIVMCGTQEVSWASFRRGLCAVFLKPKIPFDLLLPWVARLRAIQGIIFGEWPHRLEILRKDFRSCHCLDPRDRVYGVLALMPRYERALVPRPDYTRPVAELYRTMTLNFFEHYQDLNLLCECELQPKGGNGPTWAPDWSVPRRTERLLPLPIQASSQLPSYYQLLGEGVLRVVGISKSTVTNSQTIPETPKFSMQEGYEGFRELMLKQCVQGTSVTGISMMDALVRTLLCDSITETFASENHASLLGSSPSLEQAKRTIETILTKPAYDQTDFMYGSPGALVLSLLDVRTSGRTLLHGTDGYMGLGPPSAEINDEICVLSGCTVPLVLRPQGDGNYIVVGECFAIGLTQGEALLGPLPDHIRVVAGYHEDYDCDISQYRDSRSGECTVEDPRLASLPIDLDDFREFRDRLDRYSEARLGVELDVLRKCIPGLKNFDLI
ncbi:HET-domain-containing protein [Xylariaceae sp. FL1019]|nr:HET-domain-containing protein [Xylariaceae sp. FL1019]